MRKKSRSGISLMEVLIATFILSIGLLGVAAMIPIGKLAMIEVEKSDRTGACGRAALHEVRIRKFLDFNLWSRGVSPGTRALPDDGLVDTIVFDPLGYARGITDGMMGPLERCSLLASQLPTPLGTRLSLDQAESIFLWGDDLLFVRPEERTAGTATIGTRPVSAATDVDGNPIAPVAEGNFTWFFTVSPGDAENSLPLSKKQNYNVSAVVCWKRDFASAEPVENVTALSGGYGGLTATLANPIPSLKRGEWVLLCGQKKIDLDGNGTEETIVNRGYWYRVAFVGGNTLSLTGPDWDLAGPGYVWDLADPSSLAEVRLVAIEGVTGVYTSTVFVQ